MINDKLSITDRPLRVVELFAGIGAPRKALTNLGISHISIISEKDTHAINSYMAVHGDTQNLGDITEVKELPECDILTYGFPCQDISIAGEQKGFKKGSGTRSGLLWEVERLLDVSPLPNILLMENVKAIKGTKFKKYLDAFIRSLAERGYTSSWTILNSKDFGIPQNRERFFMISCLDGTHYRFPKGNTTDLCLKDVLEEHVAQEYYLTPEQIANYESYKARTGTAGNTENVVIIDGDLNDPKRIDQMNRVYHPEGLAPTCCSFGGGNLEIKIIDNVEKLLIRKLTEREYWRLMGFSDSDFDRASKVSSRAQLYKQAGNSIVVHVLEEIFKELFTKDQPKLHSIFDFRAKEECLK